MSTFVTASHSQDYSVTGSFKFLKDIYSLGCASGALPNSKYW